MSKFSFLITHRHCLDGSICSILWARTFGWPVVYANPDHQSVDEKLINLLETTDNNVVLADVSISTTLAEKVDCLYRDRVILLDHHKSAIPLNKYEWCEIETLNTRSGGRMLYDYLENAGFDNKDAQWLVEISDAYDRGQRTYPESQEIFLLHSFYGQTMFVDRFTKNVEWEPTDTEEKIITILQEKQKDYVHSRIKDVIIKDMEIFGHAVKVGFVVSHDYQNMLGYNMCENPNTNICDVAVIIGAKGVSLRSNRNCKVDLSLLAQLNKGGGHQFSAAFAVTEVLGEDLAAIVANRIKIKE